MSIFAGLMRVLVISPGSTQEQLERLPAIWTISEELGASIQIACDASQSSVWELMPKVEKQILFSFDSNPSLADWANFLGTIREQDFQVCLNFAKGKSINLMLSMCHIPTRISSEGFSRTNDAELVNGWSAQRIEGFLKPIGLELDAIKYNLSVPQKYLNDIQSIRKNLESPTIFVAYQDRSNNWLSSNWKSIFQRIRTDIPSAQEVLSDASRSLAYRAAEIYHSDLVISDCPITQLISIYCNTKLIAIGNNSNKLPSKKNISFISSLSSDKAILIKEKVISSLIN